MALREKDLEFDLENGPIDCEEEEANNKVILGLKKKATMLLAKVKGSLGTEGSDHDGGRGVSSSHDASNSGRVHVEGHNDIKDDAKEKRKSLSKTKSAKPPRPPRPPSLNAADQKLIRELANLAKLKRARTKRMNASKKIPKGSSSSTNMIVLGLTIVLCLVLLFRVMPVEAMEGVRSSVQFLPNQPAIIRNRSNSRSGYLLELVAGLAAEGKMRRIFGLH